jgi:GNAT superfamily N-acetyltransferase
VREGVARAYLRFSPRNMKLSAESSRKFSEELCARPYGKILVQDSKKKILRKTLSPFGWKIGRAVPASLKRECSMVTTYDLPLDENLVDMNGLKPDLANTHHMHGIGIVVQGRNAWAFYTDDGDTARVVAEGERRQGMMIATRTEDMFEVADCLVRFLATAKKSWAVFSVDMGRFLREHDPITLMRLSLDSPKPYDHRAVPLSKENKKVALRLFSEYYDESMVQSILRLRRFRTEGKYYIYLVDGGFAITRLEGETGLIYDIYVTPSKQGQGLGYELMKCALTSLAGKVSSVYLHTSYPRAKRLYEKFGFKVVYSQLGIRLDEIALTPPSAK